MPPRDVARLAGEEAGIDDVAEGVDLSGGPLKPGHRRRALRDRRLLPKARPAFRRRPKPQFTADEAARLFSESLRTNGRDARDLLPDLEQLGRLGLPDWRTEADVAEALGLSVGALRWLATHRTADRVAHYVTFALPKRRGGFRLIMAPKRRLKRVQRTLLELLVSKLPVSDHAHGFRPGRSIRTNAEPHVGRAVVLTMDLRDFFPSVTYGRVRGLLIASGYGYVVAAVLAALMTEAERQPVAVEGETRFVPIGHRHCAQGAPTSPGLCNAVARKLDRRLAGLARSFGYTYTRYADDLAFSGDDPARVGALRAIAGRIVAEEGFAVHPEKTRIARRGGRQRIAGVTVNDVLGLSRAERRRLRAALHRAGRDGADGSLRARLRGKLAYLAMLNRRQAEALGRPRSDPGPGPAVS